jgi:hypothetical protein
VPVAMLELTVRAGMLSDAVPPVDKGVVALAVSVRITLDPVPTVTVESAEGEGIELEPVPVGTLAFAVGRRMEEEAGPIGAVSDGVEMPVPNVALLVAVVKAEEAVLPPAVELAETAGNEFEPVPRGSSVELAEEVATKSEEVSLTLVPGQMVMLAVGIGTSTDPVDLDLEKDPTRLPPEILSVVLFDGEAVTFEETGGKVIEGGVVSENEVTLLGLDGVGITEGCGGPYPGLSEALDTPVTGKSVELITWGEVVPMGAVPDSVIFVVLARLNEPDRLSPELVNTGPVVVPLMMGLRVMLGIPTTEVFAEGTITPVPPVTDSSEVPPIVVKAPVSAEPVMLTLGIGDDKGAEVGDGALVPKPPVEFAVLTPPLTVATKLPDVALGSVKFEVIGVGVIAPPPPVEKKTEVFPPALSCAEPEMIDSEAVTGGLGMPVPAPPVKLEVDVAPPTVRTWLPEDIPVPWPLPPVAFAVIVDPDVAYSASPDVTKRPVELAGETSCVALVCLP